MATPVSVDKRTDQNPPDFEVLLKGDGTALIEVTEGSTPAEKQLNNSIMNLNAAII